MSVIGNSPATSFKAIQKQTIIGTGATAYALNYPVSSPNDLEVFVNNIRQEPIISYNASTQTITFSEAVDSTDSVYVIYQGQTMGSVVDTTAYRKTEVDSAISAKVSKSGDTMTGALALPVGGLNVGSGQFSIDSAGRIAMPYQPIISGQIGTAIGNPNGPLILPFDEFWVSRGITYNGTTKRFTVPVDGIYRITLNPFFRNGVGATRVCIGVNNDAPGQSTHYGHAYRESTTYDTGCLNSVVSLSANDYIVFYLVAGGLYTTSTDRFNQFTIAKIA